MATSTVTKPRHVINAAGQWLNADAAASYLRALAAGCPAGGISGKGAGRTYAEQAALYAAYKAGKGNLAAKPGTSLHERGNALDLSRGTAAQLWMVNGGSSTAVKSGEKIRAHAYGWYRTVPSEPWHFAYDRARDTKRAADLKARLAKLGYADTKAFQRAHGLSVDGVDGPQTWWALLNKPRSATATATAPDTKFWATTYNAEDPRFGGKVADDAKVIAAAAASVYLLVEAPEKVRDAIRASKTGGAKRWLVWVREAMAVMWDSTKWRTVGAQKRIVTGPTSYHGALITTLEHIATKRQVQFVVLHLAPKSVASEAARKSAFDKIAGQLDPKLPTIIGGDFNSESVTNWAKPYGLTAAATKATVDHGKRYDYLLIRHGQWTKTEIHDPGAASDHLAIRAHAVIPAIPTT